MHRTAFRIPLWTVILPVQPLRIITYLNVVLIDWASKESKNQKVTFLRLHTYP